MKEELARRATNVDKVLSLFKSRPLIWIDVAEFMQIAGAMAWRTRISDARKIVTGEGGRIENELGRVVTDAGVAVTSRYRYVPYIPIGVDSTTDRLHDSTRSQLSMF